MGYDVAMWGSLKFPAGGVDAWRELPVDGSGWSDWTMWFQYADKRAPRTVEQHLSEWAKFGEGSEFFDVAAGPSKVDVQAFISEDTFVQRARSIAALFRVAERAGATGKVTLAGVGTPLAYRLTLSKKGSTFEALEEDLEGSLEVMKVLRAAMKHEEDRKKETSPTKGKDKPAAPNKAAPKDKAAAAPPKEVVPAAAGSDLPPDAAAAMEGVYAILEKADPATFMATPRKIDHCVIRVQGRPARVEEMWKTREAMLSGLRGQSGKTTPDDLPSLRGASLFIAAALDREATEPLARRILLSAGHPVVRTDAALALVGASSDETVEALFSVLPEEGHRHGGRFGPHVHPVRRGVEHALANTGRADVGERTLALLTPKALKIKTGPRGDCNDASFKEQEKEDFVRALLYILGNSKYRPARPRLIEVFQTTPLLELRVRAGEAILFTSAPEEIRAVFGQEPDSFFKENMVIGVFNRQKAIPYAQQIIDHLAKKAG